MNPRYKHASASTFRWERNAGPRRREAQTSHGGYEVRMTADGPVRRSKSPTVIEIGAGQVPGEPLKSVSPVGADPAKFALFWARWEPAFVAQQHREWFA
jgi:hypothetical protein